MKRVFAIPGSQVMPLPLAVLEGARVRLEPLTTLHVPALLAAADGPRGTFSLTNVPGDEAGMRRYVEEALAEHAQGLALPFAIVDREAAAVVGSTRFGKAERWAWPSPPPGAPRLVDAVEIGWTWLAERAQRTPINTEAKLLLLGHAFEVLRARRVTLKTDARNARSRAAIERIGARFDGVLRAHLPAADGGVRDSAFYSIVEAEWPAVRVALGGRLAR